VAAVSAVRRLSSAQPPDLERELPLVYVEGPDAQVPRWLDLAVRAMRDGGLKPEESIAAFIATPTLSVTPFERALPRGPLRPRSRER